MDLDSFGSPCCSYPLLYELLYSTLLFEKARGPWEVKDTCPLRLVGGGGGAEWIQKFLKNVLILSHLYLKQHMVIIVVVPFPLV